jgi:hypothetical protein
LCDVDDSPRRGGVRSQRLFDEEVASLEERHSIGCVTSRVRRDDGPHGLGGERFRKKSRVEASGSELPNAVGSNGHGDHLHVRHGAEHSNVAHTDRPGTENDDSCGGFAHQRISDENTQATARQEAVNAANASFRAQNYG